MAKKKKTPDLEQEYYDQQSNRAPLVNNPNPYPTPYPYQAYQNPYPAPTGEQLPEQREAVESEIKEKTRRKKTSSSHVGGDDLERKYHRQQKGRYFLRIFLILMNFILILYFVYLAASGIMELVEGKKSDHDSFIGLCKRSQKESKKIYQSYLYEDRAKLINDYAVVGTDLYLADSHLTPSRLTGSFQSFHLLNVCAEDPIFTPILTGDRAIDFNLLDDGDYLVFPDRSSSRSQLGKINSQSTIYEEIYTLPQKSGDRKLIKMRNNKKTPGLVLSVETVTALPFGVFDLAIYKDEKTKLPELDSLVVKTCLPEDGYGCIYEAKATIAIDLTRRNNLRSSFDKNYPSFVASSRFTSGVLSGYDEDDFIREQSGYLGNVGICLPELAASCYLTPYRREDHRGSRAYAFDYEADLKTLLQEIREV